MDESAVIQYMDDPSLAFDPQWRLQATNDAFEELLGELDARGQPIEELFRPDPALAADHETKLRHYPDVGGVVDGGDRHFDPDHATIAALHERRDPGEDDPDVGIFVDGDLRYFHLRTLRVEESDLHLLVMRDITCVKDHEQDLNFLRQVMGRVLRHNLRNDLSVIQTYASLIADESDDDRADWATTIYQKSNTLVDTTEKTRLIEQAIENNDPVVQNCPRVLSGSVEAVRQDNPGVDTDIVVAGIPDVDVSVLGQFQQAMTDTLENAVIYGSGTVDVEAQTEDGWLHLTIDDDGPGIPDSELKPFERRGETDLNHGSGAGLWLLYTVVHESGGQISFDTEGGTTVRIRLPIAPGE